MPAYNIAGLTTSVHNVQIYTATVYCLKHWDRSILFVKIIRDSSLPPMKYDEKVYLWKYFYKVCWKDCDLLGKDQTADTEPWVLAWSLGPLTPSHRTLFFHIYFSDTHWIHDKVHATVNKMWIGIELNTLMQSNELTLCCIIWTEHFRFIFNGWILHFEESHLQYR